MPDDQQRLVTQTEFIELTRMEVVDLYIMI